MRLARLVTVKPIRLFTGSGVVVAAIVGLSVGLPCPNASAQVLRDPPTPYHFLRYEDVPDDEQNPNWPYDFWKPLKFIPLDFGSDSYINFGGEDRERIEHFSEPFFGLTPRGTTTYDMHRLLLQGDLHLDDSFRAFVQFGDELVTSPSLSPPTDVDRLDLQQGFADLKTPIGSDGSLTFRGGRQEITFGSSRLVDVREGANGCVCHAARCPRTRLLR
jgi:Alginate export